MGSHVVEFLQRQAQTARADRRKDSLGPGRSDFLTMRLQQAHQIQGEMPCCLSVFTRRLSRILDPS